MVSFSTFKKLAMSFNGASEEPHFEKTSFRVKKKIFATYDAKNERACLKLSIKDQDLFSLADKTIIYPVNNKWGFQGWTIIELKKVKKSVFEEALKLAYFEVVDKSKNSSQ